MSPRLPGPEGSADCVEAWLEEAGQDPTGHAYGAARSRVFDAVRRDGDGPVARRLASLASGARGDVRLRVLRLLTDLAFGAEDPTAAARIALPLLNDPDPPVRRAAAWLLAEADRAAAEQLLTGPGDHPGALDPVTRLALAEAMLVQGGQGLAERLRTDADPAVRLRATPAPEGDAVLEDLDAAGTRLGGPGSRVAWRIGTVWGQKARSSADESDCYAWVARLAVRPTEAARLAAVDLAAEAMRHWRAAPAALAPHLRPLLADPWAGPAAARVLGASLEAAWLCREELAEPGHGRVGAATVALARIGDVRALPELCRIVRAGAFRGEVAEAARGLAGVPGTDLAPLVAAAVAALDTSESGSTHPAPVFAVLSACGAAGAPAVPSLVRMLTELTDGQSDDVPRNQRAARLAGGLIATLGAIGPAAAPALPLLDSIPENGPGTRAGHTAMALIRISGDRRRAEETLGRLGDRPRDIALAARILEWLAGNGGLEPHHVARLRERTADAERAHPRLLVTLWLHAGDEPTGPSLDAFLNHAVRDGFGLYVCQVLGALGPAAAPALPTLRAAAEQRVRIPMYIGDCDQEMREDERLAEALREALRRIGELRPGGPGSARETS
ncbi:HEAT repeat domain-containing protein [Streptomyces sp. NBC_01264]|uniref:HEAT repeat domain-containing protein n=1 Tax=Streptomyces sp. NBC_01264 TaxID=2903804 RepID=UPI002257C6AA|nr:HEAT repeat domain-containing protein [Streptomyces sp. NBC_01264]MCX4776316.1 hypothetical protein [Streptomyces sp. NBC_01264]